MGRPRSRATFSHHGGYAGAHAENRQGATTQLFRPVAISPDPEFTRNCKRVLSQAMPYGRGYKETLDAPMLARSIHLDHVVMVTQALGVLEAF